MVAEREQITSLRKPPEGWFWSPEARERRRSTRTNQHDPTNPYSARYTGRPDQIGKRPDAESTVDLPTLRPDADPAPTACMHCGSRYLHREPSLGEHQRGLISCGRCSRQLCWLAPEITVTPQPRHSVITAPHVTESPGRVAIELPPAWERPACGDTCRRERVIVVSGMFGQHKAEWREYHDADRHDRHQAALTLALAVALAGGRAPAGVVIRTGPLAVDLEARRVFVDGAEHRLTETEWDILSYMARHLGRLCPSDEILGAAWPEGLIRPYRGRGRGLEDSPDCHHIMRVNVSRLRDKLGPAAHLIENRVRIGYMLLAEPPTTADGGAP